MALSLSYLLSLSLILSTSAIDWKELMIDKFYEIGRNVHLRGQSTHKIEERFTNLWLTPHQFTYGYIQSNIRFYVYTRMNLLYPSDVWPGNKYSFKDSYYEPSKKSVVLIHGFQVDSTADSVQEIKNKLLRNHDVNVIGVDYGRLMDHWWYKACSPCGMAVIVVQAPKIGQYVGELVSYLVDLGQSPDRIHIVGHSLGAHIAGFAGKYLNDLNRTVARITGLDPSSPGFTQVRDAHRLAYSDAKFTDCIFTSAKSISVRKPICQANFYPNGCGLSQPGCFTGDFQTYGGCSHSRAVHLFAESVESEGIFRTKMCDVMPCVGSYATCWDTNSTLMGFPANPSIYGIFLTQTNDAYPFSKDRPSTSDES